MTAPFLRTSFADVIGDLLRRVKILESILNTVGFYEIKITADDELVSDAIPFTFEIPPDLDGKSLVFARAFVTTVDSTDDIVVQYTNLRAAAVMLSTPITIDQGELSSKTAAVPPVIDPNYPYAYLVLDGDQIQVSYPSPGTDALGLGVMLRFV